jgi:hypothetical protein
MFVALEEALLTSKPEDGNTLLPRELLTVPPSSNSFADEEFRMAIFPRPPCRCRRLGSDLLAAFLISAAASSAECVFSIPLRGRGALLVPFNALVWSLSPPNTLREAEGDELPI